LKMNSSEKVYFTKLTKHKDNFCNRSLKTILKIEIVKEKNQTVFTIFAFQNRKTIQC